MKRTRRPRLTSTLALTVGVLQACTAAPASTAPTTPSPSPPITASPAPSAAPSSELVGEWEREQRCEEIVAALADAELQKWILDFASAFVPGATGGTDIADPAEPCAGAVPLRHSHFFTADGRFGSRDQVGHEVDSGTYRRDGADSLVISTGQFPDVTFHIDIRDDTITFEPEVPECRPDCFEAAWSVTVAFPGLAWQRVDGTAISEPRPWVLDGEAWIVFGRQSTEPDGRSTGSQYLVRPDGTGEHRLINDVIGSELRAAWSPDGRQLAYIQEARDAADADKGGVWLINADGTNARQVAGCAAPCTYIDYLDWAPDGGSIYFGQGSGALDPDSPPTTFEIWRHDLATGEAGPFLIRTGDDMTVEQPKISPDGTRAVYLRQAFNEPGAPCAIFIADLVGGPERQVTDWELYASAADWSANDLLIFNTFDLRLYSADDVPGARNLYTIRPDGTALRQLTFNIVGGVRSGQARWTPDGSGITYTEWTGDVSRLAYIAADGSGQRLLTETGTLGGEPELRPAP